MPSPAVAHIPDRPHTTAGLRRLGLNRREIYRLVEDGVLTRVLHGVYLPGSAPLTLQTKVAAMKLVLSPHHVVVDRSAAWLHEIDVLTFAEHDTLPPIEVCALRGRNPTDRDGCDGRTRDLLPEDTMMLKGIRVTTPLRTALDLGCVLRRREAFAALCSFARTHGITRAQLTTGVRRYRRRRGVVQLRELAALVSPHFESEREAWTFLAIHDAGLAHPTLQYWIVIDGVPTYRLDLAYPHLRVCVEYDGVDAHDQDPRQREYDETRRQWLRDHGWTVIVVRVGDFTGDRLDAWLRELATALRLAYSNRRW